MAELDGQAEETKELKDSIDRLTFRIEQAGRAADAADRAGLAAMRFGRTAILGAGSAMLVHKGAKRAGGYGKFAMGAAQTAGFLGMRGTMGLGLSGGAMGKVLMGLKLASGVGFAVAGLAAAAKMLKSGTSGGSGSIQANQDEQTKILAMLYRETLRQTKSAEKLQAIATMQADPFAENLTVTLRRLQRQGTAITAGEAFRAARLESARGELAEAQAAVRRALADTFSEFRTGLTQLQGMTVRAVNDAIRGTRTYGGAAIGGIGAAAGAGMPATFGQSARALQFIFEQMTRPFQSALPNNLMNRGPLGGPVERELFDLMRTGPGQIIQPSPTVRAGEASDYAFRVNQQRLALQREVTTEWQDSVIALLTQLVELGKASEDDLYRTRARFGRTPIAGVE